MSQHWLAGWLRCGLEGYLCLCLCLRLTLTLVLKLRPEEIMTILKRDLNIYILNENN